MCVKTYLRLKAITQVLVLSLQGSPRVNRIEAKWSRFLCLHQQTRRADMMTVYISCGWLGSDECNDEGDVKVISAVKLSLRWLAIILWKWFIIDYHIIARYHYFAAWREKVFVATPGTLRTRNWYKHLWHDRSSNFKSSLYPCQTGTWLWSKLSDVDRPHNEPVYSYMVGSL